MRRAICPILFVLISLAGCKSFSNLASADCPVDSIKLQSFKELSGVYSNAGDTLYGTYHHAPYAGHKGPYKISILDHLFMNVPEEAYRAIDGISIPEEEVYVDMKFISEKRLIAAVYQNDRFIFAKVMRGKYRNGYFYLRPRNFIIPFIPLAFGYYFKKARIGKCGERLVIDYRLNDWGFFLVAGSSDKIHTSSLYSKKAAN